MLTELPRWITHLHEAAVGQARLGSDMARQTRSDEAPMRFNSRASDALDRIHATLVRWAQDLTETRGVPYRRPRAVPVAFIGPLAADQVRADTPTEGVLMALWLARHVTAIAGDDAAALCLSEISACLGDAERVINRPQPPRLWGRCLSKIDGQDCAIAIYGRRDAIEVRCPKCKTEYNAESLFIRNINASEYMHFTREELIGNQRTQHDERYWSGIMGELDEFVHYKEFQRWVKDGTLKARRFRRPNGRCGFMRRNTDDIPEYLLADIRRVRRQRVNGKVGV
ncbi:Gp75 protein (modular protein) [uncultured Mycobacterium sp.]|uniref:Gp75 protein (Modular protein) n=1 Tax=uncultured Mycobacterium sp. TaxID=171292 RepID=A0A1Y5P543_9MYCO|nr:Gp75 protein (modular protein) [uncultured Mycobacterium sp.]